MRLYHVPRQAGLLKNFGIRFTLCCWAAKGLKIKGIMMISALIEFVKSLVPLSRSTPTTLFATSQALTLWCVGLEAFTYKPIARLMCAHQGI